MRSKGTPSRRRRFLIFSVVGGVVAAVLLLALAAALDYSDQPSACGQLCHDVMGPQYTTYQSGAHARVRCVECHVGPGLPEYVQGKVILLSQGLSTLRGAYPRPIPSPLQSLRPARDTCESCHWPEKFYEDRVREVLRYAEDEANTESRTYLVMKTGGPRGKKSPAIHWHLQSQVLYVARDAQLGDIPWVGVREADGSLTEYQNSQAPLTPDELKKAEKRQVDCVLCHNRATHAFQDPAEAIDLALAEGRIDANLPFVKKKGLELLTQPYNGPEQALSGIAGLGDYYQLNYPKVYAEKGREIGAAVRALQEIYQSNVFPKMKVTWGTYPDNLSHNGCFRCHNQKMVATGGKTITTNCNACHELLTTLGKP